ncbi:MAG: DNA polymerase/3'-5' exonuclease PolX [Rhizomicrobium sp.]
MATASGRRVAKSTAIAPNAVDRRPADVRLRPAVAAHNTDIADRFERYAVLLEIDGANPFRVRAYRNAARTIENLPRDVGTIIAEGGDLDDLPGIGKDLAGKIAEISATGRFHDLEELEKRLPAALVDLTRIPGLGPKRVKTLFDSFKITSLADLAAVVRAGRLHMVRGFGPKIEKSIREAAERQIPSEQRLKLFTVEPVAMALIAYLEQIPGVEKVAAAGSFRRRKETVGDLDILAVCRNGSRAIARFLAYGEVAQIVSQGTTRATVRLHSGLQIDLRVVAQKSYGSALLYFTGSKAHNIALRALGMKRGLKLNEYGVYRKNEWIAGKTEKDVYACLQLAYIEPELRENQGELEAAAEGRLPHLVTLADIKGDLHVHTDASDGNSTLEEMAAAAQESGYEYLAITDHSKRLGITHGLDAARLRKQMASIDRLNARLKGLHVLKSAEVDILSDGTLDLGDDILRDLDLVVAAVHSKFDLDSERQTERIIRAMDNPYVTIIAHPTGRLIGEREPCAIDIERLMKAAVERNCALEVNAQPSRLDLTDAHCRMAKEFGAKLAISTDAHSAETLEFMRFGVDQARRGWLEAADVANTRSLGELRRLLRRH